VADTAGRYVRVVGHGNSVNTWNSVTEAEIWGN
jgi:poly(beta-D-mannuronate) lyase